MKKRKDDTIDPALVDWRSRYAKRHADDIAFEALRGWIQRGGMRSILSFPAAEWLWERNFTMWFPHQHVTFCGLDSDPDVLKLATKHIAQSKLPFPFQAVICEKPTSFLEHAGTTKWLPKKQYDMIYLDWMGTWSKEKLDELDRLFSNRMLKSDGVLRFTVSMTRGCPANWDTLQDLISSDFHLVDIRGGGKKLPEWRTHGIPSEVIRIAKEHGYDLKPIASQLYYNYRAKGSSRRNASRQPEASFMFISRPTKKKDGKSSKRV